MIQIDGSISLFPVYSDRIIETNIMKIINISSARIFQFIKNRKLHFDLVRVCAQKSQQKILFGVQL